MPDTDAGSPDGGGTDAAFSVDPNSLRALASPAVEVIGTSVRVAPFLSDDAYREVLGREYNSLTPGNAMKWGVIHPEPDRWAFENADAIVSFAEAHKQVVRGHTLIWHMQLPSWIQPGVDPAVLRSAVDDHIATLVGRYRGRIAVWDVVNEAVVEGGLRQGIFLDRLGPEYIADAFRAARAADPEALLAYNDYGIESKGVKQDTVFDFLSQLRGDGVPVDSVGLQMHVSAYEWALGWWSEESLRATIRRFGAIGLSVEITELDVKIASLPPEVDALAIQAQVYRAVGAACHAEPACRGVTTWGWTDAHSWIDEHFGPDDPLPYDEAYQPKPAREGLRAGLAGEPSPVWSPPWDTGCAGVAEEGFLCDPLEGIAPAGWWTIETDGGAVSISDQRAAHGRRALHVSGTAGGTARANIGRKLHTSVSSESIWARALVFMPSTSGIGSLSFMGLAEGGPPYDNVGVNLADDGIISLSAGATFLKSSIVMPRDRWVCVRLRVQPGASVSAELYVDKALALRANSLAAPATGFGQASFGLRWIKPGAPALNLSLDDLAIADRDPGCPQLN